MRVHAKTRRSNSNKIAVVEIAKSVQKTDPIVKILTITVPNLYKMVLWLAYANCAITVILTCANKKGLLIQAFLLYYICYLTIAASYGFDCDGVPNIITPFPICVNSSAGDGLNAQVLVSKYISSVMLPTSIVSAVVSDDIL